MLADPETWDARLDRRKFPANFFRGERLGIERVELTPGSVDVQQQAPFCPPKSRQSGIDRIRVTTRPEGQSRATQRQASQQSAPVEQIRSRSQFFLFREHPGELGWVASAILDDQGCCSSGPLYHKPPCNRERNVDSDEQKALGICRTSDRNASSRPTNTSEPDSQRARASFKYSEYRDFISVKLSPPNFSINAVAIVKATTASTMIPAAARAHTSLRS